MPEGINPTDLLGLKKAPLRLVPKTALIEIAKVMGLGAEKYGPYNWREHPIRYTVYTEAAMRHLIALEDGQDLDPESGASHAAHVAACMALLLDAIACEVIEDDRHKSGKVAEILENYGGVPSEGEGTE